MSVEFNPDIVQKMADRMYSQARTMVIYAALSGALLGGLIGLAVTQKSTFAMVGALFFGLLGAAIGNSRALTLRVEAQKLLCQLEIEKNTRALRIRSAAS